MKKSRSKTKTKNVSINCTSSKCSGCGYFLGVIGAAIYYISTASGFWAGVLGILKAFVWPAVAIFEVLKYIGA